MRETLVLYSRLAFYPMHWEAFRWICEHCAVRGVVMAGSPPVLPEVHRQLGWVDPAEQARKGFAPEVRFVPEGTPAEQGRWLRRELRALRPDAIWVQEEPTDHFLLEILRAFYFDRGPRIVTAVCENVFGPVSWSPRLKRRILWRRLDGLLAVAQPSVEGSRRAGMPESVPAVSLVGGAISPPEKLNPSPCPSRDARGISWWRSRGDPGGDRAGRDSYA